MTENGNSQRPFGAMRCGWWCAFFKICPALAIAVMLTCAFYMPIRQSSGFTFAFCSDIHYDSGQGSGRLNENLEKWRRQLDTCDFLVVGGDLTGNGTEAEFAALHKALRALDKTVYTLPGNHDLVLKGVPDDRCYRQYFGENNGSYFVKHRHVGLLFLDLSETGAANVTVSDAVCRQVEKMTARVPSTMPVIVFSHFPLHPSTPRFAVRKSDRIFSILGKKNVIGYFSGHYHGWAGFEQAGVPFFTAGTLLPGIQNHDASNRHGYYRVVVNDTRLEVVFVPLCDEERGLEIGDTVNQ